MFDRDDWNGESIRQAKEWLELLPEDSTFHRYGGVFAADEVLRVGNLFDVREVGSARARAETVTLSEAARLIANLAYGD